jgi:predicted transcriptional regulator
MRCIMAAKVTIEIDADVFERLKALAEPLVDTTSSLMRRILDEWQSLKAEKLENVEAEQSSSNVYEEKPEKPVESGSFGSKSFFATTRGVKLPFGKLRASYKPRGHHRREFAAEVTASGIEFAGDVFEDPSLAGVRAKELAGAHGDAASTNGWEFWEFFDQSRNTWIGINEFRKISEQAF